MKTINQLIQNIISWLVPLSKTLKNSCISRTGAAQWETLAAIDGQCFPGVDNVPCLFRQTSSFLIKKWLISGQLKRWHKLVSALHWVKWSNTRCLWCLFFLRLSCVSTGSQPEPVYVHKISAAFDAAFAFTSRAHGTCSRPPRAIFRNFLIWASYLFISNPLSSMSMSV